MTDRAEGAVRGRLSIILTLVSVAAPGLAYLVLCAPGLTWLDGGELVAASYTMGTAHPPGHPLYALVGRMLAYVLPGSVAFRYNLTSALFAVAALAAVRGLLVEILSWAAGDPDRDDELTQICASAGTLVVAFVPAFADQALRAEVYSLGFVLEALLAWASIRAMTGTTGERAAMIVPLALFTGLGLCVHNLSVITMAPLVVTAAIMALVDARPVVRPVIAGFATFFASLSPYMYQALRSARQPYIDLGHVHGLTGLWHVFEATSYRASFTGTSAVIEPGRNLGLAWEVSAAHLTWSVLALAAAGVVLLFIRSRLVTLVILATVAAPIASVIVQRDIYPRNPDHGAYVFISLLLIVALGTVAMRHVARLKILGADGRKGAVACTLVALAIVFAQILPVLSRLDMRDSTTAHSHAGLLDAILPADSIVLLNNDEVAFPLLYAQAAEGRRLDVTPVTSLQYTDPMGYCAALRHWPDRLPPAGATIAGSSVTMGRSPLVDAIVAHAASRRVVLWDLLDDDTIRHDRIVPFYHLGRIVPEGATRAQLVAAHGNASASLKAAFESFFFASHLPDCDAFALSRLATGPLARTALIHLETGDLLASITASSLGLGLSPDEGLLYYNRAVALERAGLAADALADYERASSLASP